MTHRWLEKRADPKSVTFSNAPQQLQLPFLKKKCYQLHDLSFLFSLSLFFFFFFFALRFTVFIYGNEGHHSHEQALQKLHRLPSAVFLFLAYIVHYVHIYMIKNFYHDSECRMMLYFMNCLGRAVRPWKVVGVQTVLCTIWYYWLKWKCYHIGTSKCNKHVWG